MIAEAIDTVITLGWALLTWIVLLAAVASLAGWTVLLTVAWACRGLWRAVAGATAVVQASRTEREQRHAPEAPQTPSRPSWAHTEQDAA